MKISSSCRAKIGAAGQVLASKWAIFTILKRPRLIFARQKCHHPPNTKHEVTPLSLEIGGSLKGAGACYKTY